MILAQARAGLLTLAGLLAAGSAQAKQIKVIKAVGQKAVVVFPSDVHPANGSTYELGGGGASGDGGGDAGGGRENSIDLSANLTKTMGTSGSTSIALDVSYGFNFGNFEIGPSLSMSNPTNFTFGLGAFADYNFTKNAAPETVVFGLGVNAGFTHSSSTSTVTDPTSGLVTTVSASVTQLTFEGGPFVKLFLLRHSQSAIRIGLDLAITTNGTPASGTGGTGTTTTASTTATSIPFVVGIQTYF